MTSDSDELGEERRSAVRHGHELLGRQAGADRRHGHARTVRGLPTRTGPRRTTAGCGTRPPANSATVVVGQALQALVAELLPGRQRHLVLVGGDRRVGDGTVLLRPAVHVDRAPDAFGPLVHDLAEHRARPRCGRPAPRRPGRRVDELDDEPHVVGERDLAAVGVPGLEARERHRVGVEPFVAQSPDDVVPRPRTEPRTGDQNHEVCVVMPPACMHPPVTAGLSPLCHHAGSDEQNRPPLRARRGAAPRRTAPAPRARGWRGCSRSRRGPSSVTSPRSSRPVCRWSPRRASAAGYVLDASVGLPPVNFTPAQAVALALAVRVLPPGSPFGTDAEAARAKVLDALPPDARHRADALAARVWSRPDEPAEGPGARGPACRRGVARPVAGCWRSSTRRRTGR